MASNWRNGRSRRKPPSERGLWSIGKRLCTVGKYTNGGKRKEGGTYNARISYAQQRREINLGTLCRNEAARKAIEIWRDIQCQGWEALEEGFLDCLEADDAWSKEEAIQATFSEYLSAYVDKPGISHLTADDNRRKVLTPISGVVGIERPAMKTPKATKKKWRAMVESVRMSDLNEIDFTNWRNASFESLSKGRKCGALASRTSPMSVKALIRSYKSVINEEHRERLQHIPLPDPVPGLKIRLLKERRSRYRGGIDGNALLEKADAELKAQHPELQTDNPRASSRASQDRSGFAALVRVRFRRRGSSKNTSNAATGNSESTLSKFFPTAD